MEGRRRWLVEMGRVLRPEGVAVLVVGDGVVGDRAEDAAGAVAGTRRAAGLKLVARASQDAADAGQAADRDLRRTSARREHILLLRRGG